MINWGLNQRFSQVSGHPMGLDAAHCCISKQLALQNLQSLQSLQFTGNTRKSGKPSRGPWLGTSFCFMVWLQQCASWISCIKSHWNEQRATDMCQLGVPRTSTSSGVHHSDFAREVLDQGQKRMELAESLIAHQRKPLQSFSLTKGLQPFIDMPFWLIINQ